ncbi:MAG: hypothetical protein LC776_03955 [Acidobacteria bacterium]|nr:hypothetical protein [Acidobacteriota bacterium]
MSDVATAATEAAQERIPEPKRVSESLGNKQKISLSNETAVNTPYETEVHGEATNNDAVEHSASIKATFYDSSSSIIGTADGFISQIESGQTKTYTLTSQNVIPKYARLKVQVDAIF